MKSTVSSYLILIMLFLFVACGNDYDSGTRHPNKQGHNYHDDHDKEDNSHSRLQDKYQDTNFSSGDGSNRWIWQKPNLIIEKLQPLDGKVVADIGAGPYGYFALRIVHQAPVAKVIAIDIDPEATKFMEEAKKLLPEEIQQRFETRLVESNDPKLAPGEADVVLIVNTASYFKDRVDYLNRLRKGISAGGKIVIIDFKKRNTPVGPDISNRVSLGEIEKNLKAAGYKNISADDRTLEYQYIVVAMIE